MLNIRDLFKSFFNRRSQRFEMKIRTILGIFTVFSDENTILFMEINMFHLNAVYLKMTRKKNTEKSRTSRHAYTP